MTITDMEKRYVKNELSGMTFYVSQIHNGRFVEIAAFEDRSNGRQIEFYGPNKANMAEVCKYLQTNEIRFERFDFIRIRVK